MKLRKMKSLCKKSGKIVLATDADGAQWCGDGKSIYLMEGMPRCSRETIFALLDIEKSDRSGYAVDTLAMETEFAKGSSPVEVLPLSLSFGGKALVVLKTSKGIRMVERENLEPLPGTAILYEGGSGMDIALVAMDGFFPCAKIKMVELSEQEAIEEIMAEICA